MSSRNTLPFSRSPRAIRILSPGREEADSHAHDPSGAHSPLSTEAPPAPNIDFSEVLGEIEKGVRNMEERVRQLQTLVKENVIDLAVCMAEHLLHAEIEKGNYDFQSLLGDAVGSIEDFGVQKQITLKVNPLDFSDAIDFWRQACGKSEVLSLVQILQDEEIPRASWKVEALEGSILSDMENRLLSLKKNLMKAKGEGNGF